MGRRVLISTILGVVILAGGAGVFKILVSLRQEPEARETNRRPLTVSAIELRPETIIVPMVGFGTAQADRLAVIGAQVTGQVVELAEGLRAGVAVEEGALLLRIDERDYQAQLARAQAMLAAEQADLARLDVRRRNLEDMVSTAKSEHDVSEREYGRDLELIEAGTSNPRELDVARLALQRARRTLQQIEGELAAWPDSRARLVATCELRAAEVELADLNVGRCRITAPFAGRIESMGVEIGEQVRPGQQLLKLQDASLIEVPIELPVSWRASVRVGAAVRLSLESRPDDWWSGQVARISPSANESTRCFSVFAEVVNEEDDERGALLTPGMFVEAHIDGPTLTDVLLVPRGCVRRGLVYVCEGGLARERAVIVERQVLDRTVVSGLEPGEVVITSNLDVLAEGLPVTPVGATARPAESQSTTATKQP